MATAKTAQSTAKKRPPITGWFKQWLEIKDQAENVLVPRQNKLRDRLKENVHLFGEEDDKGNVFYDLPTPVQFEYSPKEGQQKGDTVTFTRLKAEKHVTPAQPTPDPQKAVDLLEAKKLWLTSKQKSAIVAIQRACPYAVISVDVDPDAVADALFEDKITEDEYEATLVEQKVEFQFRPQKG